MSRTLCDWSKKDIHRHADELLEIVSPQNYLCEKCARTACDERYLCRGVELAKLRRRHERELAHHGNGHGHDD